MATFTKFALALSAATMFTGSVHAQALGGGGGLIAAGTGAAVPTVAGPPPLGVPLNQQILAGISGPASTGGAVGAGLGGLAAGPLALGLGAIVAVGAVFQGGGGSTSGTN